MPDKIGKISYPIRNDYEFKEFWDKNIDLYGIIGWFVCDYGEDRFTNQATAFGGYLKLKKDDGSFDGEIVDMWGRSRIAGVLNDINLNFNKIYVEKAHIGTCSTLIHYNFSKSRKGIWIGSFMTTALDPDIFGKDLLEITIEDIKSFNTPYYGRSNCKIYPFLKNAYGIMGGPIKIK
ncbi:MAG: hypothetical protein ABIE43_04095 [Patescibacteria group bacterium]